MRQALVLLSQEDTDAPALPGLAVVSKDDAWDDGGWALGVAAVARGALVVDRPYFTGNPSVDWMVAEADRATAAGMCCQIGNENNLDLEAWQGGIEAWRQFDAEVRARVQRPDLLLAMPPSPGTAGWQTWVTDLGPFACHAYGTYDQMREIVRWYLDNRDGDVYVTECNFGAGQQVDVDAWAHADLAAFLDWCATEARVKLAAYFAWRWRGAPPMPTPVDAAGTAVEDVLVEWEPPDPFDPEVPVTEWCPFATARPIARNYTPGRAGHAVDVLVDHIADGDGSPYGWYNNPAAGGSTHFWVSKSGLVEQYRPLSDTCWSNGIICDPDLTNAAVAAIVSSGADPNAVSVAIEHEGFPGETLPPSLVDASHRLHAWLSDLYGVPLDRERCLGHYQFDNCSRAHCPGEAFPWEGVLGMAQQDVQPLRDRTWALCDQLQRVAAEWTQAQWPSTGSGVGSAAEAIKTIVRGTSGQK